MNFRDYQDKALALAFYPNKGRNFVYPVLGLAGESGEVADKIKKILRDDSGRIDEDARLELQKELGDVLWYVAALAFELNLDLDGIASLNLQKLESRKERGTLAGSGDNR